MGLATVASPDPDVFRLRRRLMRIKATSAKIASAMMTPMAIPAALLAEILGPLPEPDAAPTPEELGGDVEFGVGSVVDSVGSASSFEEVSVGSSPIVDELSDADAVGTPAQPY